MASLTARSLACQTLTVNKYHGERVELLDGQVLVAILSHIGALSELRRWKLDERGARRAPDPTDAWGEQGMARRTVKLSELVE